MNSTTYERRPHHPVDAFPSPQRALVRFLRWMARWAAFLFAEIGLRVLYVRDTVRAFREPGTWLPITIQQMRAIGVDSMPLAGTVAAFIGAVTGYQTVYQLFPGVQLSIVGWIVRQTLILEIVPLLTALALSGRVGARMTAEIGTMRVTEQIDALETLAFDPIAYLVLPRVLAGFTMVPLVTILSTAVGIFAGGVMVVLATKVTVNDYITGLRLTFIPFQVYYAIIKSTLFGGAISLICSYEGYTTEAGAEGVGRSTARAVVISSVIILLLDALTAVYLAPKLA